MAGGNYIDKTIERLARDMQCVAVAYANSPSNSPLNSACKDLLAITITETLNTMNQLIVSLSTSIVSGVNFDTSSECDNTQSSPAFNPKTIVYNYANSCLGEEASTFISKYNGIKFPRNKHIHHPANRNSYIRSLCLELGDVIGVFEYFLSWVYRNTERVSVNLIRIQKDGLVNSLSLAISSFQI